MLTRGRDRPSLPGQGARSHLTRGPTEPDPDNRSGSSVSPVAIPHCRGHCDGIACCLACAASEQGWYRPVMARSLACLLACLLACSSMACSLARVWPARLLGLLARLWPSPARDGAVRLYRRILGLPRCALTPKHPLVSLHPLLSSESSTCPCTVGSLCAAHV